MQLLPLQGRDKLAKGWGTVGRVVVGVEEIEGSREPSCGVTQCENICPSDVAGCVGSVSRVDSDAVTIIDVAVGVSGVFVPLGPPSCCRIGLAAVAGVTGQEMNVVTAGGTRVAALSVGFVSEGEIDGSEAEIGGVGFDMGFGDGYGGYERAVERVEFSGKGDGLRFLGGVLARWRRHGMKAVREGIDAVLGEHAAEDALLVREAFVGGAGGHADAAQRMDLMFLSGERGAVGQGVTLSVLHRVTEVGGKCVVEHGWQIHGPGAGVVG